MISSAESLAHLVIAAGISTAMVGRAFVGHPLRAGDSRRRVRRLWLAAGALGAAMSCGVAIADSDAARGADPSRIVAIVGALGAGALVAFSLAYVGVRGRRVGDHPHCRRCGFDLFGRPDDSLVCSECGAPLDAPRAIVVGTRQRRLAPLLAGVFVGIVALAYATSLAPELLRWSRTADFSSLKPDAWLIDDLWNRNRQAYQRAIGELSTRAMSGKLGRATVDRLVTRLLARPLPLPRMPGVDPTVEFAAYVAEQAWQQGVADEATVRRAMQASLACTLVVAPRASAGRTLRYWISIADYRIARDDADDRAGSRLTVANRVDTLDGAPLPAATWSTLRGASEWPGLEPFGNAFDLAGHTRLGPATLTIRCAVTLTLATPGRPVLVESRDVTLTGASTIVDASAMRCPPVVAPTSPNALAPAPQPALRILEMSSMPVRVLDVQAPRDGAMLVEAILHGAAVDRSLGVLFADANGEAQVPITPVPEGAFTVELRPVPERGADLFKPPAVFAVPVMVPSSQIENATGD